MLSHSVRAISVAITLFFGLSCGSWYDTGDSYDSGWGQSDNGDFLFTVENDAGYEDWYEWVASFGETQGDYLNATFLLPSDLEITHNVCGMENAYWDGTQIVLCYEMLQFMADLFYNSGWDLTDQQFSDLVYWSWTFILYHELGHGLIDLYELPIPGREEDAVDSFSAVMLIEGNAADAVVQAALFWWLLDDVSGGAVNFADEHSMNMQRFYNLLCWVYGSDPSGFSYIPDTFPEMQDRVANGRCEGEYEDQRDSWMQLLQPWFK
jgi:hypothetical protein